MSKKSNMVLKSTNFRKHVKMWLGFLTLINILTIGLLTAVVFYPLFFKVQKPTAKEIYSNNIYSIVEVKATSEDVGESFGTAEFLDNEGRLVTNAHVVTYTSLNIVNPFEKFYIRFSTDEEYIEVSLIKFNSDIDIAILQMNPSIHKFSPIKTADSTKISTGDKVYAIGNSANYGLSMSEGIIGSPLINIHYNELTRNVIQANINITEGNSGGALVDDNGCLIGITTFRTKDHSGNVIYGISYCIPINTVLEYIK